ncbi:MAG: hypothetical protein ACPHN2_04655 [Sinimarinibacterium flocculans]|uniref:hypothetical protein n=1 Tax=Sinimarinibacterium flocculans TaxID=985250 RepID=UPI003C5D19D9
MSAAVAGLVERLRRAVYPEAPRPAPATTLHRQALLLKASEVLFYAAAGNLGAKDDDLEHADRVADAFLQLLVDYRFGAAQTVEERALGEALDHIARAYLES